MHRAQEALERAGVENPRLDAELLLAWLLGRDRTYVLAHPDDQLSEAQLHRYQQLIHRRSHREPLQYITGVQEFYGRPFRVTPAVLIPRPETEQVVEAVLARITPESRVLDIGCGSGAIAITVQLEKKCRVFATDLSPEAIAVARENALRLSAQVSLAVCNLARCFQNASFDVVVSNPPYVGWEERHQLPPEVREYEPAIALYAGSDGLAFYPSLIEEAARVLKPGGWLVLELGYGKAEPVRALLREQWTAVSIHPDLAGIPRVLCARRV